MNGVYISTNVSVWESILYGTKKPVRVRNKKTSWLWTLNNLLIIFHNRQFIVLQNLAESQLIILPVIGPQLLQWNFDFFFNIVISFNQILMSCWGRYVIGLQFMVFHLSIFPQNVCYFVNSFKGESIIHPNPIYIIHLMLNWLLDN